MLKNAPTLAIVAVHTEENEPPKVWKQKISLLHSCPSAPHQTRAPPLALHLSVPRTGQRLLPPKDGIELMKSNYEIFKTERCRSMRIL